MAKPVETVEPQFLPDDDELPGFGPSDGEAAAAEEAAEAKALESDAVLTALGAQLQAKFNENERKRVPVEDRWLEDLRQFHGRYDPTVDKDLREAESCALFLNLTKPKTNAFSARVMDMVLPTDTKNWGLEPTPVPEIVGMKASPTPDAPAMTTAPDGTQTPMTTDQGAPVLQKDIVKGVGDEADSRCEAMEEEIDDQLAESKYNGVQRQAIEQMAKLGTGIIMGPVILDEWRVKWKATPRAATEEEIAMAAAFGSKPPAPAAPATPGQPPAPPPPPAATGAPQMYDYVRTLVPNKERRAGTQWVDCWNFYPDMSCPRPDGWEFAFVQYIVNKSELKKFAKRFNFIPEATKRVLEGSTPFNINSLRWMMELRTLSESNTFIDDRYRLLRYYGELNEDDLMAVGMDPALLGVGETIRGSVWFVDSTVLKVDLNPLDSGDLPFSVCYTDKDEASPFGVGIPRLMRGEQESINAAWRMMHDNAGLSVGPQTVMKMNQVTPADGDYHLKPKKMWYAGDDVPDVRMVFHQFTIDSHQDEIKSILDLGIRFADDTTQLPLLMQGDQAPHITQTAQGMSLLYNASTVVLRRTVKFYDDYVTEPLISRFYDWNMQFNPRSDIKGDFRCVARGSSTLLDKEQQGQALDAAMQLAMQPTWQPYFDMKKLAREAMKGKRIGDVMNDDDTIAKNLKEQQDAAAAAQQAAAPTAAAPAAAPPPDPLGQAKIDAMNKATDARVYETDTRKQIAIANIASKEGISLHDAQTKLASVKVTEDAATQRFNAELDVKTKLGTGI